MRKFTLFIFSHFVFWFAFFLFFRLCFLYIASPLPDDAGYAEIIRSLFEGYELDLSIASYLVAVPLLSVFLMGPGVSLYSYNINKWYFRVIIPVSAVIAISNLIIFKYWGTLLNSRAVAYLAQPREALASVTNWQLVLILTSIIVVVFVFMRIFERTTLSKLNDISLSPLQRISLFIGFLPLIVIGFRGGLQQIPVNESAAVFSSYNSLNLAATNPVWNLGHELSQSGLNQENPFVFLPDEETQILSDSLLKKNPADTASVFNLRGKPNVVIILLESWTADIIESLNGIPGVTPYFTQLVSEGLLFDSVYSSGFRTDQALVSALSGFPSQPDKSIIRYPSKAAQLPSLAEEFAGSGYVTSFYYGGETGFANMNSYLVNSGYRSITDIEDFSSNNMNSKWGAHDEFVFEKQLRDLKTTKEPFFSTLLTLSTHEPFEVPVKTPFETKTEPEQFKKSAWYTDKCLSDYFREARKQSWYPNTVFVLLADHGHRLPLNRDYYDPRMRQIPVLFVSDLLKNEYKGTRKQLIANQHDLPATILRNLGMDDSAFGWSVSFTDPKRAQFAYLSLDVAMTFVTGRGATVYPFQQGMSVVSPDSAQTRAAQAYLQRLYRQFLDL